ncbi:hypothetical protein B0J13DRAFT_601792 [Dactylonectria estremocensis]|uniref:Uncharacterized protein n=1 Tax=Dactylonectria estremocensis TaxID=1079267 RepID=A0A9P9JLN0_9HYPO|nr:hypothetical protein B0J13DRAFT_601792 [Dactylonectria estremocensis]
MKVEIRRKKLAQSERRATRNGRRETSGGRREEGRKARAKCTQNQKVNATSCRTKLELGLVMMLARLQGQARAASSSSQCLSVVGWAWPSWKAWSKVRYLESRGGRGMDGMHRGGFLVRPGKQAYCKSATGWAWAWAWVCLLLLGGGGGGGRCEACEARQTRGTGVGWKVCARVDDERQTLSGLEQASPLGSGLWALAGVTLLVSSPPGAKAVARRKKTAAAKPGPDVVREGDQKQPNNVEWMDSVEGWTTEQRQRERDSRFAGTGRGSGSRSAPCRQGQMLATADLGVTHGSDAPNDSEQRRAQTRTPGTRQKAKVEQTESNPAEPNESNEPNEPNGGRGEKATPPTYTLTRPARFSGIPNSLLRCSKRQKQNRPDDARHDRERETDGAQKQKQSHGNGHARTKEAWHVFLANRGPYGRSVQPSPAASSSSQAPCPSKGGPEEAEKATGGTKRTNERTNERTDRRKDACRKPVRTSMEAQFKSAPHASAHAHGHFRR